MDTSIRLPFVLGDLRVLASELTAAEWTKVLDHALHLCSHHLKYLPGFKPLAERIGYSSGSYDRWEAEGMASIPAGQFTSQTRHRYITQLHQEVEGECAPGYGARRVLRRDLLLTQSGEWVIWEADYLRHVEHGLGYQGHRSGVIAQTEVAIATLTTNAQLAGMIESRPGLGNIVLRSLHQAAHDGVEEKRLRLESTQSVETALRQLRARFNCQ